MFFRTRPTQFEARGWDGSFDEGLTLVSWVRRNGSHAHMDTRHDGPPSIVVGTPGSEERMSPDLDFLCRDLDSNRFYVLDRRAVDSKYEQFDQ